MASENFGLKAILSAVDKLSPVLKNVGQAAKNTRKYLLDVGTSTGKLLGAVGLSAGIVGTLVGGFSLNMIKESTVAYANWAGSVTDTAKAVGLAADEFQRLSAVAEREGAPVEVFTASIGQLNKRIALAAAGKNEELAGLMKKLGINMRTANGEIVNGADLLPQLADAFQKNENAAVRARMGNALFGKSWEALLPMLVEGSSGLASSLSRIDQLRTVFSDDDLRAADEFSDQLHDLAYVSKGLQYTIASGLVPVLSPLIEDLIQWAAANKNLIAIEVKRVVVELVAALRSFDWQGFVGDIKSLITGFISLVEAVGGAKNALIGLFVLMNLQGVAAFLGLGASVVRLGWHLLGLAGTAAPAAVTGVGSLTTALSASNVAALGLMLTLAKLFAAFSVGYAIGTGLNSLIDSLVQKLTGDKSQTLGGWLHDKINGQTDLDKPISLAEVNAERAKQGMAPLSSLPGQRQSPLVQASAAQSKVNGRIAIDINGAPAGTKVTEISNKSDVSFEPKVGYRSLGNPLKTY